MLLLKNSVEEIPSWMIGREKLDTEIEKSLSIQPWISSGKFMRAAKLDGSDLKSRYAPIYVCLQKGASRGQLGNFA